MTRLRVIGLGQRAAGDDAAGAAVLDRLREMGAEADAQLVHAPDPSALIELLETPMPVVLVDALRAARSGEVLEVGPEELGEADARAWSSHALGVQAAIELARLAAPDRVTPSIRIVAITIGRATPGTKGMTPPVAKAVNRAAERVLGIVRGDGGIGNLSRP